MHAIGVRELKAHATEILWSVREEGTTFEVTYRGRVIARLVPASQPEAPASLENFWDRWDALSRKVSARWPEGVSAVDAVREARREL